MLTCFHDGSLGADVMIGKATFDTQLDQPLPAALAGSCLAALSVPEEWMVSCLDGGEGQG